MPASGRALPAGSRAAFLNELQIGSPIQLEPVRQHTLGTLSLRLRDTASAAAAAAALERLAAAGGATTLVRDLDRGLRARLAWQRGRPEEALRLLEALESRDTQGDVTATPFVARASVGSVTEVPLQAPSHLRQAEIHERLGNRDEAAAHHARVLELWRDADPAFRHLVGAARSGTKRRGGQD